MPPRDGAVATVTDAPSARHVPVRGFPAVTSGPGGLWLIYVRRSYKKTGSGKVVRSADVSDEVQVERCRALLPEGASVEVIADSGGHQSGRSDKRDGWQEVIRRIETGGIAGIVAYDVSRIARNARLILNLHHALERSGIELRIVQMPNARWDSAEGRFMLGQLALAAQYQADIDSKRMADMSRSTFESGGHLGNDPLGYRTRRNDEGEIIHPRTLEIVEQEAEVVRRVWRDLPSRSTQQIADALQREGVQRRVDRPWTRDAVKDIVRRGRFYLGFVVYKRSAEELPGTHEPIIDEATWAAGRIAADDRGSAVAQHTRAHRTYLLTGLIICACGKPLHGQTRTSRGKQWVYYLCRACDRPSIRAEVADAAIRAELRNVIMPDWKIAETRDELRRRLALPSQGESDEARSRLERRSENLVRMFEWGDIAEATYRTRMAENRVELARLPAPTDVLAFDAVAHVVASLRDTIDIATEEQLKALLHLLVERIEVAEDGRFVIEPKAAARPFFV